MAKELSTQKLWRGDIVSPPEIICIKKTSVRIRLSLFSDFEIGDTVESICVQDDVENLNKNKDVFVLLFLPDK